MKLCGVYCICNEISGLEYVGQSTDILKRWEQHIVSSMRQDTEHPWYVDMRLIGLDSFSFSIIELCDKEKLDEREAYWIYHKDTLRHGYNLQIPSSKEVHSISYLVTAQEIKKGKPNGRPRIDIEIVKEAISLVNQGFSIREATEATGISRSTYYRYKKEL